MRLATRKSLKTVQGATPVLRPRLPSNESRVPSKLKRHGSWKTPVGENREDTDSPHAGLTNVFGRTVKDESCRLLPFPVMMLKGRPEANSTSGAKVQSLRNLLPNPSPPTRPV